MISPGALPFSLDAPCIRPVIYQIIGHFRAVFCLETRKKRLKISIFVKYGKGVDILCSKVCFILHVLLYWRHYRQPKGCDGYDPARFAANAQEVKALFGIERNRPFACGPAAAVVWMTRKMVDVPASQDRRRKLQCETGLCGVVQRGEGLFWSGLYNALLFAAAVFAVPFYGAKMLLTGKYRRSLGPKFGRLSPGSPTP